MEQYERDNQVVSVDSSEDENFDLPLNMTRQHYETVIGRNEKRRFY